MKKKLLLLMIPVVVGIMLVACDEHEAVIIPIETLSPTKVAGMVYTPPPTPTPTPTPTSTAETVEYVPDPVDVEYIAKTLWGEARGIDSDMEKAAVAWCILNRVDNERWGDTVEEVVTQPNQFHGYHPSYPVTDELREIAENKPGFIRAMWCGDQACEDKIKEETTATSRCMPFEQEQLSNVCACCGKPADKMVYWGKAY